MNDQDDETAPLVQDHGIQVSQPVEYVPEEDPPPYSSYDEKSAHPPPYYVRPTTPTPSEGTSGAGSLIPHINCRVCQAVLSVEGKLHLHVIKCHSCGEATPIRPAPSGKKYVRCPCNCLLICKATSQRIICPRPNCKRVISLGPSVSASGIGRPSERRMLNPTRRIICAHCDTSFLWVQPGDAYDKCPHCDRFSSFGPGYRRKGIKLYGVFGALMFIIAMALTGILVYCEEDCHVTPWSFIAFGILYAVALFLFIRAVRFACIKVSRVERSNLQYT